jgi:hypothetical protein
MAGAGGHILIASFYCNNFAKFPDYIKRFTDVDLCNFIVLDTTTASEF